MELPAPTLPRTFWEVPRREERQSDVLKEELCHASFWQHGIAAPPFFRR
jgi:hypothetical protein